MKKIFVLTLLFSSFIYSQEKFYFVNHGPQASKSDGDPNFFQIINFELKNSSLKNLTLQIFDPDCIGNNDSPFGNYNSQFRFSLYKGEIKENQVSANLKINSTLLPYHIFSKTFRQEVEYDNQWIDFVTFSTDSLINNNFSLLITGTNGDDANVFKVRIIDEQTKDEINDINIYSFQPTLRLVNTEQVISFILNNTTNDLTLHTFDFDGAKISYNTLLKHKEYLTENNPNDWNESLIPLNEYEKGNKISVNIDKINILYNDITFYVTDTQSNLIPIDLNNNILNTPDYPFVNYKIDYKSCNNLTFNAENVENQKYTWAFEDGSIINNNIANKIFETTGNYYCKLFVEKESDAITRAIIKKIDFKINDLPHAEAGENKISAPLEKLTFDASSSFDKDGSIKTYIWNFGDGNELSGKVVSYSYKNPGKYLVKLKVIDDFEFGCNSNEDSLTVFVNSNPIIKTQKEIKAAVNQTISFDASQSYDVDGEIISYKWQIDNSIKNGSNIEYNFSKPGQYLVKITVTDNSSAINNSSTETIKVMINNPPKAIIKSKPLVAENEVITFDGSQSIDSDGKIISYKWLISDKSFTEQTVNYAFNNAGNYKVKLIVIDDSETLNNADTTFINITVNSRPKAIIENEKYSNNYNILFDGSKSYDTDGKITKYIWDFGDGTKSNEAKTFHKYKIPGKYTVTLKVIDNTELVNNYSIDTSFVIINKKPIADAGRDYLIPPKTSINFSTNNSIDPDGKISKVKWYVNNTLVSEDFIYEHKFNEPGKYVIKLEVEDDFVMPLKDIDSSNVIVNNSPIAKINCIKKAIPNEKIKFDANNSYDKDGKIINYSWLIEGKNQTGKTVEYSFPKSGLYKAILFVEDDSKVENSIGSDTVIIKINSSPIIKTANEIFTCDKLVHFDASNSYDPDGDNLLITWKFPESNEILTGKNIFYYFKEFGVYPVILNLDDLQELPNSKTQQIVNVIIHQPPVANAGNDTTVCTQDLIIFNGLKSNSFNDRTPTFEWTFSDSTKYFGPTIVKTFEKEGVYNVILKVTDDSNLPCNTSYDSKVIKVIDTPHANAGEDISACVGVPIKFDGSKSTDIDGVVNSYTWDFGDGESSGGERPKHIYNKPGTYKVILTITGNANGDCGNTSQDELVVNVSDGPFAAFTAVDSTDENTNIIFDASKSYSPEGKIVCYDWDFGDGEHSSGKIVKHSYKNYGNYIVTLRIESDINSVCNSSNSSAYIYINKKPTAKIISPQISATNENILFDASSSFDQNGKITKYIWDFGDGSTAEGLKTFHNYSNSGKYKIKLKVIDDTNTNNNFSIAEKEIIINASPIAKFTLNEKYFTNEIIKLDASSSSDIDGKIINYKWFSDDEFYSSNIIDKIKFATEGFHTIKLVVEDNSTTNNRFAIFTKSIQIIKNSN